MVRTKIRSFRESDIKKIMEFKRQSVKLSFPRKKMNEARYKKRLLRYAKKQPDGIRVVEDGEIAGYIWFSVEKNYLGRYGLVHHIYIDKNYRNLGLGKKLMKLAEGYFKRKGIKRIKVTITLGNKPSLRMCKRLGYKESRIIMERFL